MLILVAVAPEGIVGGHALSFIIQYLQALCLFIAVFVFILHCIQGRYEDCLRAVGIKKKRKRQILRSALMVI
jgi:hypothetical protein